MMLRNLILAFAVLAGSASADTLAQMQGEWRGSGWARETPQGPQETVRCQIDNRYDDTATLTLTGLCIVPGKRLTISGTLRADEGSGRITGHWSNPDGIGRVPIVGAQQDGIVAFNFNATEPATGQDVSQNVEWRVSDDGLRLRSNQRRDPDNLMSDISFNR